MSFEEEWAKQGCIYDAEFKEMALRFWNLAAARLDEREKQLLECQHQLITRNAEVGGLREIAWTAGRLVRAANVTPMTSTNGCGLAAIGKELATLEKLLREPK